jgi:hypothetical protein
MGWGRRSCEVIHRVAAVATEEVVCIFYVATKRQMVDDLGGNANEAIHRGAAVATEEVVCIFYVAIKRQIVDDLGGNANEAIHRVAAVATKEMVCIFYVATKRQIVDDLGGSANEAIHRVAAVATEECGYQEAVASQWRWMRRFQIALSNQPSANAFHHSLKGRNGILIAGSLVWFRNHSRTCLGTAATGPFHT